MGKQDVLKKLKSLPGVGDAVADDLYRLGYRHPDELKQEDPGQMYQRLCELQGGPVDRCMLYVFRCAVYSVSTRNPEPEKLNWWFWKDTS